MSTIEHEAMTSMAGRWRVGDDGAGPGQPGVTLPDRGATEPPAADAREPRDRSVLEAVGRGDRLALERIYRRHGAMVYAYLLRQLAGDPARAEDALQDVMLAVWKGAAGFRGESRVRTWMLAIAHRIALQDRRKQRAPTPRDAGPRVQIAPDARAEAERRLSGAELRALMLQLPADLCSVLDLTLYQGLSTAEAGEVLGLPAGTVKSRLFRARARLRAALDEERGS